MSAKKRVLVLILPLAFVASCAGFLGPAVRIVDSLTHKSIDGDSRPFPVLVIDGDRAWVKIADSPSDIPPATPGTSYLVSTDRLDYYERYLFDHEVVQGDANWVIRVASLSADTQRIELFLLGDGYWGSVYDATQTTITPRYRKITGPLFSLVFGSLAIVLNCLAWGLGVYGVRKIRRVSRR